MARGDDEPRPWGKTGRDEDAREPPEGLELDYEALGRSNEGALDTVGRNVLDALPIDQWTAPTSGPLSIFDGLGLYFERDEPVPARDTLLERMRHYKGDGRWLETADGDWEWVPAEGAHVGDEVTVPARPSSGTPSERAHPPQVARYHDGDEWEPARANPAYVVDVQRKLARSGLLGDYKPGVWDRRSADAYRIVLHRANYSGLTAERQLAELVDQRARVRTGLDAVFAELGRVEKAAAAVEEATA